MQDSQDEEKRIRAERIRMEQVRRTGTERGQVLQERQRLEEDDRVEKIRQLEQQQRLKQEALRRQETILKQLEELKEQERRRLEAVEEQKRQMAETTTETPSTENTTIFTVSTPSLRYRLRPAQVWVYSTFINFFSLVCGHQQIYSCLPHRRPERLGPEELYHS